MHRRLRDRARRFRGARRSRPRDHLERNRRYWDRYAQKWTATFRGFEGDDSAADDRSEYRYLGEEWGNPQHLHEILDEFVFPHIDAHTVALEIGAGGGRLAAQIAPRVKHLYCVDISEAMLARLRTVLGDRDNVSLIHVDDANLRSAVPSGEVDFAYSFDVFVHLDLHTIWKYVQQIAEVLRPAGLAFLHTTNLLTGKGWERFSSQEKYTLEGHYFITPEILDHLALKAGLTVVKKADEDPANFYKARDCLVLLRK